jgi:ribonuclease HII
MTRRSRPFVAARAERYPAVVGVDEVGRGALCGPVVVAAVWFDPATLPAAILESLDDSKRIRPADRERIAALLQTHVRFALRAASPHRIDCLGIRHATLDAMRRAVHVLGVAATVVVDGRDVPPGLECPAEALVQADSRVPQVAAASVIAKVMRDPAYGWDRNAGYGTREHMEALARVGATRHHRRSFAPVVQLPLGMR